MQERGISTESVEEAIAQGYKRSGAGPGRTMYDLPASKSSTGRGIRVIVDNATDEVITVIDKGRRFSLRPEGPVSAE
ncbi:MAG: DUF4258 domain-containing protein [Chloroflexi bacterium]|nr:DUF4258 domain-containing protein [Chloroflexota bacterium]